MQSTGGGRKHSASEEARVEQGRSERSHPGDLTQTMDQICVWAHEKHRLGSP